MPAKGPRLAFRPGDTVEVCGHDDGFLGSWYPAVVVLDLGQGRRYKVQYTTLLEEDQRPVEEAVDVHLLRPPPPTLLLSGFSEGDAVEMSVNDGWWVGTVTKVLVADRYLVYFRETSDFRQAEPSELRIRQDWVHNQWQRLKDVEVRLDKDSSQLDELRLNAYSKVLKAFYHKWTSLTWKQEQLLSELRCRLQLTDEVHLHELCALQERKCSCSQCCS